MADIILHKLLPQIFLPSGVIISLLLLGIIFPRRRLFAISLIFFWIISTPLVSDLLIRNLEAGMQRKAPQQLDVNAIIVLSEGRSFSQGDQEISEWTDSDRFWAGVELSKYNPTANLIFTGAKHAGYPAAPSEGAILRNFAIKAGVDPNVIYVSDQVRNTYEESLAVKKLFEEKFKQSSGDWRVALITSAFHMPRASSLFSRAGFTIIEYPVDFKASQQTGLLRFFPFSGNFATSEFAIREFIGRIYYRITSRA